MLKMFSVKQKNKAKIHPVFVSNLPSITEAISPSAFMSLGSPLGWSVSKQDVRELLLSRDERGVLTRKEGPDDVWLLRMKNTASINASVPHGSYDFVMMQDREIRVTPSVFSDKPMHVYLSELASFICFAGTIMFEQGKITAWNNLSCDYVSTDCALESSMVKETGFPVALYQTQSMDMVTAFISPV